MTTPKLAGHTPGPLDGSTAHNADGYLYFRRTTGELVGTAQIPSEIAERWNAHESLLRERDELREALEGIARRTSACIARNRNEKPDNLLDMHAEIIDVQIKARAALENARALLAKVQP